MQCMICHEEGFSTSSLISICESRPEHAVCRECYQIWRSHPRTRCPLCRGPLRLIPPTLLEKIKILFHTLDEDLRNKLARLVQDRPGRWCILGIYLYATFHIVFDIYHEISTLWAPNKGIMYLG